MRNPDWLWTFKVQDHEALSEYSMTMFDTFSTNQLDRGRPHVSEWVHPDHMEVNNDWQKRVRKSLLNPLQQLGSQLGYQVNNEKDVAWSDMWMYRYTNGGKYGWHGHNYHLVFCYYVKLDDPSHTTMMRDPWTGKIFNAVAEEGDVAIFPSFILHSAPKVLSEKVIIAGNLTLKGKTTVDL